MRLDVLDRFEYPWFRMTDADADIGEDVYFCVHAKKAGARIWCDGSYKIGHIVEPTTVSERQYREYVASHRGDFPETALIGL
jgi:hypothetical protein